MIRFTCPNCSTPFTVGDEKAGKAGKCPKCQSQFTIPNEPNSPNETASGLLPPPVPEAPPPVPAPDSPIEIAPCPGCGSRLSVVAGDLGLDIECPNCQTQYKALRAGEEAPPPPKKQSSDSFQRPSRRREAEAEADDEDNRPARRSIRKRDDEEDEVRPSRRSSRHRDDEDDEEYVRRSKPNAKPGALTAVSVMLLVGGILSCLVSVGLIGYIGLIGIGTMGVGLVCCLWPGMYYQLVFGIMAIVRSSQMLGKRDMKGPPKGLCIMQIICIVNGDVTNCVLGIVGLVLLGQEDVRRWYSRRGFRY